MRRKYFNRLLIGRMPDESAVNAIPSVSALGRGAIAGLLLAIQIVGPIGSDIPLLQLARFFECSGP